MKVVYIFNRVFRGRGGVFGADTFHNLVRQLKKLNNKILVFESSTEPSIKIYMMHEVIKSEVGMCMI